MKAKELVEVNWMGLDSVSRLTMGKVEDSVESCTFFEPLNRLVEIVLIPKM